MRSAIWLRVISEVPPAIDMARVASCENPANAAVVDQEGQLGPDKVRLQGRPLVPVLGQHQLGHVALGSGPRPGHGPLGPAQVEHLEGMVLGHRAPTRAAAVGQPVAMRLEQGEQVHGREDAARAATDGDPLVAQGGAGHRPAVVGHAHHVVVGHEDVVEEDLVEVGVAR